jgi:ABC-type dipeptide/oligopeptide/nickel transport system permease component
MGFSQVGMAVPSFWLGILLLLALAVKIPLFPLFGSGSLRHLVLPAVALGIARAAVLLRLTRASMVEELSKEYVITARAKGLTERMVKYKHALRNGLLPVVTIAGISWATCWGPSSSSRCSPSRPGTPVPVRGVPAHSLIRAGGVRGLRLL